MELRPYQKEAVAAVEKELSTRHSTLICLATGGGKTIIFSNIAKNEVQRGGRVLILAHRSELLEQAIDKLYKATGIRAGLEKADSTTLTESWDEFPHTVVVGSVQTLSRERRLKNFRMDEFSMVIIDECHHAMSSTYRTVIDYFKSAKILGVTATPDRGDMQSLAEVFETISFEYSIVQAIRDGFLVPIAVQTVPLKIDLTGVQKQAGDYQVAGIGSALDPYLERICKEIAVRCKERKTIVFTPLIATSLKMVEMFKAVGVENIREVNGNSDDREEIIKWFATAPKGSVLVNSMLLTEGFDEPSVDAIVVLRATKVRSLYCLDEQTEILTKDGWKSHVLVGESVATFNTATNEIEFKDVIATIRRDLEENEYFCSIKAHSSDIRVTNKHRMLFDNKRRKGWKFATAEYVSGLADGAYYPVAGKTIFKGVPLTDAEVRFIGWVMTDGSINRKNKAIQISQSSAHVNACVDIQNCIDSCNFKYGKRINNSKSNFNRSADNVVWTISYGEPRGTHKDRTGWARLSAFVSKDISELLFDMTEEQFDVLIQTINLADGTKLSNINWTQKTLLIGKGNKTFIENLQIMALMRGYRANMTIDDKPPRKNPYYFLHLRKQMFSRIGGNSDSRPRWVKEPHTNEKCWCVETEAGTLVTRRNGCVTIVGNCQMVGRGTRLSEGKKNLLVLDFLWLTQSHDLCRPASLISDNAEVVDKITQKQLANEEVTIDDKALDEANNETVIERENMLAERLKKQRNKKASLIDPLQYAQKIQSVNLMNTLPTTLDENDKPTLQQLEKLEQLGFACPLSATAADALIKECESRSGEGLATAKQVRMLSAKGFKNVERWSAVAAKKMIARLAMNGWHRMPAGINPETYVP